MTTYYPPLTILKCNGVISALDRFGIVCLSEPIGTDDSSIINNALTMGSTTLLPGTYIIKRAIIIPENTTLSGVGRGSIITQPADTLILVGAPMILVQSRAVCKDLKLDGNAPATNTNGVQLNRTFATISNCEIANIRQYAVWSYKGTSPRVIGCEIHGCLYPISFTGDVLESDGWCNGGIAYGNYTYDAKLYNKIRCAKNCRFVYNHVVISVAGGDGIICCGADGPYRNITITGNVIENTLKTKSGCAILAQPDANAISENVLIDGNSISGNFAYTILPRARNTVSVNNMVLLPGT
jgi:hypothetical protein